MDGTEVCGKGLEQQRSGGQVGALDFGRVLSGTANEVLQRVEADGAARGGASGAAGTLVGGRLADAADLQCGQARPGGVAGDAGQAAIDDGCDAFDGDGTLGNVG